MAIVYLPGIIPSTADLDYSVPIGLSQLGTPVIDDIYFPKGVYFEYNYKTFSRQQKNYSELRIQSARITVSMNRNIVRKYVAGRDGTIPEFVADGDYVFSIEAKITEKFSVFPVDQISVWREIAKAKDPVIIESKFFNSIWLTKNVVIDSFECSTIPGSINELDLSMQLSSYNNPINLKDYEL